MNRLNPYFIGLPILIEGTKNSVFSDKEGLNPYFIGLPILILKILYRNSTES